MCAWNLSQTDCQVTIVDRDRFGAGCSHGNCGYISPSHVFPLCQPGAISKTLKGMLKQLGKTAPVHHWLVKHLG